MFISMQSSAQTKILSVLKFFTAILVVTALNACGSSGGDDARDNAAAGSDENGNENSNEETVATGAILYQQDFSGLSDDAAWPDNWTVAQGSNVISATIQSEEACLQGLAHTAADSGEENLARLLKTDISVQNVDIRFDVTYDNFQNQGVGFYARQNSGFFTLSGTPGEGYGVFIEGFSSEGITFWYEDDGDEIQHEIVGLAEPLGVDPASLITPTFSVRYQLESISITETVQRAKIWLRGTQNEPVDWQIVSDNINIDSPGVNPLTISSLQNISGGFAVDVFNSTASGGSACFDNILIRELP